MPGLLGQASGTQRGLHHPRPRLSDRPQLQDTGEGLLGTGVHEVGAGGGAEGLPVSAAKSREAVHSHEALVTLPPAKKCCQPWQSACRDLVVAWSGLPST